MLAEKNPLKRRVLKKGTSAPSVFFAGPLISKIPSGCKAGDILIGTAYYGSADSTLPGDGKRPGGFKVCYTVGPKPASKKSETETPEAPDDRTVDEKVSEAVRDFRVEQLSKLTAAEKKDGKFEELFKLLKKWIDIEKDNKYAVLVPERERRAEQLGSALKLLNCADF